MNQTPEARKCSLLARSLAWIVAGPIVAAFTVLVLVSSILLFSIAFVAFAFEVAIDLFLIPVAVVKCIYAGVMETLNIAINGERRDMNAFNIVLHYYFLMDRWNRLPKKIWMKLHGVKNES